MYLANGTDQHGAQDYLATGSIVKLIVNNVLKDSKIVVIKGDTDGDGRVTLFDAVKVIGYYLDNVDFDPTDPYIEAADVDNDKSITLFDVVGTLQIYLNDNE